MTFSMAQYEAVTDKLTSGLDELAGKLREVGPTVAAAIDHWYVPKAVAESIVWAGNKLLELGNWILDKIIELLKGVTAPVLMFMNSFEWQSIRGLATGVSGQLKPQALGVGRTWKGSAAEAYVKQIKPQSEAAARIGVIADRTADALQICAGAGLAFYVALGVIVVKFIVAMIGALACLGSVALSPVGAGLIVEEAGVNTSMIIAAVSALVALLVAQASQMNKLHGEAVDASAFPGGAWPNATPGHFSDATVKDGDADWSLGR